LLPFLAIIPGAVEERFALPFWLIVYGLLSYVIDIRQEFQNYKKYYISYICSWLGGFAVFIAVLTSVYANNLEGKLLSILDISSLVSKNNNQRGNVFKNQFPYNKITELSILSIPKDIDILKQNSYDILSVDVIDENIVLHCGNIDPQLNVSLQPVLNRPTGIPFIEITYTNSEAGYLMVHFDYGDGLAGQSNNTGDHRIEVGFEETTTRLPIVGWKEGMQLVSIRIDPPDNTVFIIKNVKFLSVNMYELSIPKDIEILRQNSYDIISVDVIDDNIVLHCGNIDPHLNISLQSALNRPFEKSFIEITYTNSKAGYLMVHFDYGNGLESNTGHHHIKIVLEETTVILPIIGWHEGKQLVGIRIDPPDNTAFTIKNVKFLFAE
jgi:hypothetical protein